MLPSKLKNLTTPVYTESIVSVEDIVPLKISPSNGTFISATNLLNFYFKNMIRWMYHSFVNILSFL